MKWWYFLIGIIATAVLIFLGVYFFSMKFECGDGTFYGFCSENRPYFCDRGVLVEKAFVCGCPENFEIQVEKCFSDYKTTSENRDFLYFLNNKESKIDFIVYEGFVDYLQSFSKEMKPIDGNNISRENFKLKSINEENQREMLLPLLVEIQNLASNKKEQFKIAVSLVQNIPYGISNKKDLFYGKELNYSRYPYEVLYDKEGICGERSELLAFLLKELGYGVVIYYYPFENHEAVGVKCTNKNSYDGYCYIETTTSLEVELISKPEIIFISDGKSVDFLF
ncbi:MAG: hypothetical protein ABH804_02480 [archaeon]